MHGTGLFFFLHMLLFATNFQHGFKSTTSRINVNNKFKKSNTQLIESERIFLGKCNKKLSATCDSVRIYQVKLKE